MARDVAVDSHRHSLFVVIQQPDGTELLARRFRVSVAGERELIALLEPGDRIVMEATFGVFRLAERLESSGARVSVIDPGQSPLVGLRGKKTDYRDCRALLKQWRGGSLVEVWRPDPLTRQIRQLTSERMAYNQSIVRFKNRIGALLWDEGLEAPTNLWTAEGEAWLADQPLRPEVRRILEREQAVLAVLTALKEQQDAELAQRAVTLPDAQRLMQVPGYGPAAAVMVLGAIGRIERFGHPKQLVSYAGLDPSVDQSGERCRLGRISKAGRRELRAVLVEVAWAHVRAQGAEAWRYQRLVEKGKPAGVAIVALARHLLVMTYHLLTEKTPYRRLDTAKYESKLQRLASHRPYTENEEQPTNVDWAAEQLKELTGHPSPYRQAHPSSGCGRRRRQPVTGSTPGEQAAPAGAGAPSTEKTAQKGKVAGRGPRAKGDTPASTGVT